MKRLLTGALFGCFFSGLFAQVSNNQIENRLELTLDSGWVNSSTHHATVEWNCIHKALTNKCLIYHNDQWFVIRPEADGKYYLNISTTKCRDSRGIQVTVIEGHPCEVDTYIILHCIPQIKEDEVFVVLDSIKAGVTYLVNIDGFLGDFCDFQIAFSSQAQGIPVTPAQQTVTESSVHQQDSIVTLSWQVPNTTALHLTHFAIYRKFERDKSSTAVTTVPIKRNALGIAENQYQVTDTLVTPGKYRYTVYSHALREAPMLLAEEKVLYVRTLLKSTLPPYTIVFPLYCPKAGNVRVDIYNSVSEQWVGSVSRKVTKGNNNLLLDLSPWVGRGVFFYKIVVFGNSIKEQRYFSVREGKKN